VKYEKPKICHNSNVAADGWFVAEPKESFLDVLKNVEQQRHKSVELRGYIEELCQISIWRIFNNLKIARISMQ
jgi:hypothetical protein